MRLVFWGVVIVALCYLAYTGMLAAWAYIAVNNAVDEIISKDGVEAIPSRELKAKLMTATSEAGVAVAEKDVTVTNNVGQGVSVEVKWTMPVIVVNGDTVVAVPLTVRRSAGAKR